MKAQFPAKIKPLFTTKKRYIAIYGGRGSGKSWAGAGKTILNAAQGKLCACCREIASSIDQSMHTLLVNTIDRMGITGFSATDKEIRHASGGKIFFKGLKGASKAETRTRVKSIENVDWVWFEEAESLSDEMVGIILPTFRKKGSQQCYTFNRYLDKDPIFKELCIKRKSRTEIININYWENPFLDKQEVSEAEDLKKENYELWLHRYGGEPLRQDYYAIMSIAEVNAAMERRLPTPDVQPVEVGVDVARYGNDKTVMYAKLGNIVFKKKEYRKLATTSVCDMIEEFVDYNPKMSIIKVDDTGVGCITGETKILTVNGWIRADQLKANDKIYSKDKNGNVIVTSIFSIRKKQTTVLSCYGYEFSWSHQIPYRTRLSNNKKVKPWEEILKNKSIIFDSDFIYESEEKDMIIPSLNITMPNGGIKNINKQLYIDAPSFAEFLGWYVSEGSFEKKRI
jgi:hypothetical protein